MKFIQVVILIAMSCVLGGCLRSPQGLWNRHMVTRPLGYTPEEVLRRSGPPDSKMRLSEFLMCVDNTPHPYRAETAFDSYTFSSYREYLKYQIWESANPLRLDDARESKPFLHYNPNYVNEEPYRSWTLWIYDESKRYKRPLWVYWHCYMVAFQGDRVDRYLCILGGLDQGGDWEPEKIHFPEAVLHVVPMPRAKAE